MAAADRIAFSGGLFITHGLIMVWWLYFQPIADDLLTDFSGPFISQWDLLQWVIPTYCTIMFLLAGGYLIIGGVQKEQSRDRRRVRR